MATATQEGRWLRLGLHALAIVLSITGLLLTAPLLPAIIDHFGLTSRQAGFAVSVLWDANAVAQYPGERLADGVSPNT